MICAVDFKNIMELVSNLQIIGKDITIFKSLYWQQIACIWIANGFIRYTKNIMPNSFSIYREVIPRELENLLGSIIGGHNLKIGYVD